MSDLGCFEDGTHLVAAMAPLSVEEIYNILPNGAIAPGQGRADLLDSLSMLSHRELQDLKDAAESKTLSVGNEDELFTNGPGNDSKDACVNEFLASMLPDNFEVSVCMTCGREKMKLDLTETMLPSYEYEEVFKPSVYVPNSELVGSMVLHGPSTLFENECATGPCCSDCRDYIHRRQVPPLALCNGLWVGQVPEELRQLGLLEQLLVARALTVSYHIHVTAYSSSEYRFSNSVSVYPLDPSHCLDNILPRTMPLDLKHLARFLKVTVSGVKAREFKGKPAVWTVRRALVELALKWLQVNNSLYQGIRIDRERLSLLPENGIPEDIREKIKFYRTDAFRNIVYEGVSDPSLKWPAADEDVEYFVSGPNTNEAHRLLLQFPALFPYGKGGLSRPGFQSIDFPTLAKWCIEYYDGRFRRQQTFVRCLLWEVQEYKIRSAVASHVETTDIAKLPFPGAKLDATQIDHAISAHNMDDFPYMTKLEGVVRGLQRQLPGLRPVIRSHSSELFGMTLASNPPNLLITIAPWKRLEHVGHIMARSEHHRNATLYNSSYNEEHIHDALVLSDPYVPVRLFDKTVENVMSKLVGSNDGELWKDISGGVFGKVKGHIGFVAPAIRDSPKVTERLLLFLWLEGNPTGAGMIRLLGDSSFRLKLGQYIGRNITGDIAELDVKYGEQMLTRRNEIHVPLELEATSGIRSKMAWVDEEGRWGPKRRSDSYVAWSPRLIPLPHHVEMMTNGPKTLEVARSRLQHFHRADIPSRREGLGVLMGLLLNGSLANKSFAETATIWTAALARAYCPPIISCLRALLEREQPLSSHTFIDINWTYLRNKLHAVIGRPNVQTVGDTDWFISHASEQEFNAYSQRDVRWEAYSYYDLLMKTEEIAFHGPRSASMRVDRSQFIHVAPILAGADYPRKDADEELFSIVTLGLFKPWREVESLCDQGDNASQVLNDFLSTCPESTKEVIENVLNYRLEHDDN